MNDSDHEPDPFTEALRLDLPNEKDEARVRMRLVSAGVLAGAGVVTPSAAAAAASGGFSSKLAAMPLALKIGASLAVMGVAAAPVLGHVTSADNPEPANTRAAIAAPMAAPVARPDQAEKPATEPGLEPGAEALPPVAPESPSPTRTLARPLSEPARERAVLPASAAAPLPPAAIGAFPAADSAPLDEGTLRAETALMERALAAIKRGDLVTARRELAAHAAKFPNGHLKPERERAFERTLGKETEQ